MSANLRDFSVVVSVTHSFCNVERGQEQESIRLCFCVLADSIAEAKEKARGIVKQWVESEWPDLSNEDLADWFSYCYWYRIDSLDIGIGSNPIIL